MDKEKILRFMEQAKMKVAVIRMNGTYYFCELSEAQGLDYEPYSDVRITECPAPFEIIG